MAATDTLGNSRHSILDLAPLELDCMNALWPSGEATVRDIQLALRPTRPRAYTTIMTILDRLAHKGVVERRKAGRAWVYRARVSAEQARSHAVSQVVEGFFAGSPDALASHLAGHLEESVQVTGGRIEEFPRPSARAARRRAPAETPAAEPPAGASEPTAVLDTALL